MNSLQSLICSLAIGLSSCTSVDVKKDIVVQEQKQNISQRQVEEVVQNEYKILFEGDIEIVHQQNIPSGTHHIKFYEKDEIDFLEISYANGDIDKYFSVDLDGHWKYVEEIRGKNISLMPHKSYLDDIDKKIENSNDYDERKRLSSIYAIGMKEWLETGPKHDIKLKYYLEIISSR